MRIRLIVRTAFIFILFYSCLFFIRPFQGMQAFGCSEPGLRKIPETKRPVFRDNFSLVSLKIGIARSLNYLSKIPEDRSFHFGENDFTAAHLKNSLFIFSYLLQERHSHVGLTRLIYENFDIYRAVGAADSGEVLVTGYYEPVLNGSLEKRPPYLYPLYTVPSDLVKLAASGKHPKKVYRMEAGKQVPYWSRARIEKEGKLHGHELVFLEDPIDAFILHIQGSGRIRLPSGAIRGVGYAGDNGLEYSSIGRLLVARGKMSLEEVDMPRIIRYLKDHPDEQEEIFHHNARFIFFQWRDDGGFFGSSGPVGSIGEHLTAGRSVALDQRCFPAGALGFLQTKIPAMDDQGRPVGMKPFSRFVLNQDSGSAIKGAGRIDIFLGNGASAGHAAGLMKEPGRLYFFVKKKELSNF